MKSFRRLTSSLLLVALCCGCFKTTAYAASNYVYDGVTYAIYQSPNCTGSLSMVTSELSNGVVNTPSGTPEEYCSTLSSSVGSTLGISSLNTTNLVHVLAGLTYIYAEQQDSNLTTADLDYSADSGTDNVNKFIEMALDVKISEKNLGAAVSSKFKNINADFKILTQGFQKVAVDDNVGTLSSVAIYKAIYYYVQEAADHRQEVLKRSNGSKVIVNEDDQRWLYDMRNVYDTFGDLYPIIKEVSRTLADGEKAGNPTLEDLWKENKDKLDEIKPELYVNDAFVKPVTLKESPISNFYTINTTNGVAYFDREAIVNDLEIDYEAEAIEEYYDDSRKTDMEIDSDGEGMDYNWTAPGPLETLDFIDENSLQAITMSEYIQQGLIYSATYIPMKTNLYAPDTINQFDEEFRDEFFYKYGFYRKALLMDTSSSSAVDYYNSGGVTTGTMQVCTLRDIMESNGNDLTLYIDDNFYNAEEAKTKGNEELQRLRTKQMQFADDMRQWYEVYKFVDTASEIFTTKKQAAEQIAVDFNGIFANLYNAVYNQTATLPKINEDVENYFMSRYKFDATIFDTDDIDGWSDIVNGIDLSVQNSHISVYDDTLLKHGDNSLYSDTTKAYLNECDESDYRVIKQEDPHNAENYDTIVMPSRQITDYIDGVSDYSNTVVKDSQVITNQYSSYDSYSPMLPLAFVSALYRDSDYYSLANAVATHNPVFIASDDLCGIDGANQWYRNTILNYALIQNLKSSTTLDYNYVVDLDCPVYMDVFGNILTEGGTVIVPAASNMTLHPASYKNQNVAAGLYSVYGHDYHVPLNCKGAASALYPFFVIDYDNEAYIVNGVAMDVNGVSIKFNELSPNDPNIQDAITKLYTSYINGGTVYSRVNWVALVNISNEVMRGAPIENIDKGAENLDAGVARNRAGIVAAVKLEELIESLESEMSNTLLSIPDFTRNEHTEYLVAFMIKILIVVVTASIIIGIYRDGVSGTLGIRTFYTTVTSVMIVFAAVCVIPSIFTLTYYTANKFLLHDEALRILMYNLEKQQCGIEIGMTETLEPASTNDMALQLDWITVPWYDQLENVLYKSSLQNLDEVKYKAYAQSPVYNHYDVEVHDDGVYVTVDELFKAVGIDYTFNEIYDSSGVQGLYLYADNDLQTASFYSPYYVFLRILTANVNEYNYYHSSYNYTTKYLAGNKLKTVGLCNNYFTTKGFMEEDTDIMHIYEIYGDANNQTFDRALLFSETDIAAMQNSLWYCNYTGKNLDKRVELMNTYARDFIANNKDLCTKVTDETFLKVMALNMAIRYNQVFGVPSANALEIYNMDSNDLLRLSIVKTEEAVLAAPMSYSRFVYNFGGEAAVYCAAVLTLIMWLGSFIKPLCTIVIFLSTVLSLVVFRVVLRKPSANLFGYLVTVVLLCFTNVLHAVLLKVSTYLPNIGLPPLGCLIFLTIAQVAYLLFLAYVTGVSLKDWQNLGAVEYEREARVIKSKFGGSNSSSELSGAVPHHDDNWDYYNDLVKQHRTRNT